MKRFIMLTALVMALAFTFTSNGLSAGYGVTGCGLGGMLVKDNGTLAQIGAWFLNTILGNQTFGMTSGTSGCGEESGLVLSKSEQKIFVENNYENLLKEMAAGQGENLKTLAALIGCSAEQSEDFGRFAQERYASIFKTAETTPTEMLVALEVELSKNTRRSTSCHGI